MVAEKLGAKGPCSAACLVSRPAVKAFSPAPVRTMARVVGDVDRVVKMVPRSCHMLFFLNGVC